VNGIDVATVRARAGLPPIGEDGTAATGGTPAGPPQDDYVPVVVANGRLSVAKNIPLLLRAHQRVRAMGLDHRLLIMGEGPERPAIEAEIAALGITDSVTLAGFVAEPYGAIATADLFVLSSDSEGLPLTLIEAMAVGAPIVSTRCGSGPGLLLDGGRYGELVPVGSTDALAMAIERHLRDPQTLRERAALGPVRAVRFDAGRAADGLLTVLSALAGGTTPVSAPTRG
jgi:glycosyltransferase involved in cell wall biosynthesis